ncbi:C-C motif chemokine 36.1 isoform X2 [Puntigrus tetrazona]|uniref:C-C motif chemokine 36.1 isoform X2 n=1 Tax=Puntigrus tetrazona TaxID=1606681 RepID=UPI001C89A037|nr:C-C motif chemokine 36.1 isoform X2 [Puntigrus tetrazona]
MRRFCLCLFIGLLLNTFLQSAVMGNSNLPGECCFSHYGRKIPVSKIDSYVETREECPKSGVIFVTKKAHRFCLDPQLSWVKSAMKLIDNRDLW